MSCLDNIIDRTKTGGIFKAAPDDSMVICRCEEVTKGEIRRAIYDGLLTVTEIRRFLRSGMGLCQGRTCGKLVRSVLARELNIPVNEIQAARARPPVRPIEMNVLGNNLTEEGGYA